MRASGAPARDRPFYGSIGFTVLLFNVLLVFLPVAGFFLLDTYEKQLLQGQERTLSEQARMMATGLALIAGGPAAGGAEASVAAGLDEAAQRFLMAMERRHEARIRIFDAAGRLVADSAVLPAGGLAATEPGAARNASRTMRVDESSAAASAAPASTSAEDTPLYRLASWPVRVARQLVGRLLGAPQAQPEAADLYDGDGPFASTPELSRALAGGYGAMTRIVGTGEARRLVLYSALPVRLSAGGGQATPMAGGTVAGVVLVSQSTSRILGELYAMRLDIFRIFLWSVACAVGLSLLLGLVLTRPLARLSRQAASLLDSRGRITGSFQPLRAHNEIGLLSRSLEEMRGNLGRYMDFLEGFSNEVAHEIRNPLASVRACLDLLSGDEKDPGRRVLFAGAQADLQRINALLSAVGELGRVDTGPVEEAGVHADAGAVLAQAGEGWRLRHPELLLEMEGPGSGPWLSGIDPLRLRQVTDNILENAASFSSAGGRVSMEHGAIGNVWRLEVRDWGPGFDPRDADRLFDRFFSSRKQGGEHTGLGLAVVKSLVTRWGGRVWAENAGPGARFTVELPLGATSRQRAAGRG